MRGSDRLSATFISGTEQQARHVAHTSSFLQRVSDGITTFRGLFDKVNQLAIKPLKFGRSEHLSHQKLSVFDATTLQHAAIIIAAH